MRAAPVRTAVVAPPVPAKPAISAETGAPVLAAPTTPNIPLETKKPAALQLAAPQRAASQQVLIQGLGALQRKEYQRALQLFQEAVTIDGANGEAYYYLAKTYFALQQSDRVLGLLERADALIGDDPEWADRIAAFRRQLQGTI